MNPVSIDSDEIWGSILAYEHSSQYPHNQRVDFVTNMNNKMPPVSLDSTEVMILSDKLTQSSTWLPSGVINSSFIPVNTGIINTNH